MGVLCHFYFSLNEVMTSFILLHSRSSLFHLIGRKHKMAGTWILGVISALQECLL